ncbi:MAG: hypothetical protein AB7H88_11075 [Vicinamibacterales bacterium]
MLRWSLAAAAVVLALPAAALATPADLARARSAYNQGQYDAAIEAASAAVLTPATADAGAVVLARAHLERYRQGVDPADLVAARASLGVVRPEGLGARDRVEYLLALGEALYLEDDYGASAALFASTLDLAVTDAPALAEPALDWWGSAVERHASRLAPAARARAFRAMGDRMAARLAVDPASGTAAYWIVVAMRGEADPKGAWDAAVAGWVRARLAGARSATLRADLDRLVREGIIPDLVRPLAPAARPQAESELRAEWEVVKERWK